MITAPHGRQQPFTMVDGANTYSVFAIENGQVKIVNAKISQASIDNLVVGTSNILPGAVSGVEQGSASGSGQVNVTVNHGLGSPNIVVFFSVTGSGNNASTGSAQFNATSVTDNNAVLGSVSLSNNSQAPMGQMSASSFAFFTPPADRETTAFRFLTAFNNAISTSSISTRMLVMTQKR